MTEATLFEQAQACITSGDHTGATAKLEELLGKEPQHHLGARYLAELYIRSSRVADATALLRRHVTDRACGDRLREYLTGERMNEQALALVSSRPDDASASAWVDRAVQLHIGGNPEGAEAACRKAIELRPRYPDAYNHLGRALFNLKRTEEARDALAMATRLSPESPECWHNLGHVLRALHDHEGATAAFENAVKYAPGYQLARFNLGVVLMFRSENEKALPWFLRVLEGNPGHLDSLINAGVCLHILRRYDEAMEYYGKALERSPNNPTVLRHMGVLHNEKIDTANAIKYFRAALAINPRSGDIWSELVSVLELDNKLAEAEQALREGLQHAPGDLNLLFEGAKLDRRAGRVEQAAETLRAIDPYKLHPRLLQPFYYELGMALDRVNDSDKAYEAFVRGNDLAANGLRGKHVDRRAFGLQIRASEQWVEAGAPTPDFEPDEDLGGDLCMMVGFPRSGTTLLDVMLNAHPNVRCIEEQATLERSAYRLDQWPGRYPFAFSRTSRAQRDELRQIYRESLLEHAGPDSVGKLVVDKLPIRTIHLPFFLRLYPKAKVLFSLRHPCDVVLSNFMQHYAINEAMISFVTLESSVQTYARVLALWERSEALLKPDVHYVRYEELIEDTPGILRGVCDFLGLAWQEDLHDNTAAVNRRGRIKTNSYAQVSEPIYKRAVGRWARYRKQLDPLLPLLQPQASRLGYTFD
jgi:tetratricopeptide (TPR) repeat protein